MRHIVYAGLCCAVAAALGASPVLAAELHRTGFNYENLSRTAPTHEVRSVPAAPGALDYHAVLRVDLSDEMPPVGNQGGQGSCAAWSTTYYHRTHLEYVERHWDLTDSHHQFSPAFTYNQVNGGADAGSGFSNLFPLMCEQGCASMADCPYSDRDYLSWPTEQAYINGIPFRCKDWHWSYVRDSSGIAVIKQLLNNGFTSCLGIWVWGNFDNIHLYDYTYCAADRTGSNRGGHLVTIVGYDDTLSTHDGPGAFRVVNSWGTGWGQAGYFWMSYVAAMNAFLSMQQVGWMVDTVGYVPKMLGRVRINHPARDRVGITFLVGTRNVPLWFWDFRGWRWPHVDQPFPPTNLVFDMTEGADYIESDSTDSSFVCCYDDMPDGLFGEVSYYSVQYLPWGNIVRSRDTPLAIPDTWQMVYALASVRHYDPDVAILEGPTPTGVVDSGQTAIPEAKVQNFGQNPASFPVLMRYGATYSDTQTVVNLAPGDSTRLTFRQWTASARGVWHARCSTALDGDAYPDNDYNDDSISVRVIDVALTAITVPADTVDTGGIVVPQIRLRNDGTQSAVARAVFRIPDESYARSAQKTIEPGAETLLTFPPWKPHVTGTHIACCTLTVTGDVNLANNALSKEVTVLPGAGVCEPGPVVPTAFDLMPPSPSPFRGSVALGYALPGPVQMTLDIYDVAGSLVRRLCSAQQQAGFHRIVWNGRTAQGANAPPGAYFCRLEAGGFRATVRLLKLE